MLVEWPTLQQASERQHTQMVAGLAIAAVFSVVMIVYCLIMVLVLMRPKVVAAFRGDEDLSRAIVDKLSQQSMGEMRKDAL